MIHTSAGTVYVRTAYGERVIGSWAAGSPEGALEFFRQDIGADRDAYAAGRDLTVHHHYAAGERAVTGRLVLVGDVPQQPPGFQERAGLLAVLDGAGPVSVVHAVTGMRGWARRS